MIWASIRKDWSSVSSFAEQWQFRDDSGAAVKLSFDGRTCFFLHGYNSDETRVRAAYLEQSEMARKAGLIGDGAYYKELVGILWPGGDWASSYPFAAKRATVSGQSLKWILPDGMDLVTHSMGARVALSAIAAGAKVGNLVMLGAAVDDESICDVGQAEFRTAGYRVDRIAVVHSKNDPVLRDSYPAGEEVTESLGLVPGGHAAEIDLALGCTGPDPAFRLFQNTTVIDASAIVHEHGEYRSRPEIYAAWLELVNGKSPSKVIL